MRSMGRGCGRRPRKRKAVEIAGPAIARKAKPGNDNRPDVLSRDDTPPASAIVTAQRPRAFASIPAGLLPDTPEEHQRRGEAADALWRELVRRATATKP